MTNVQDIILKRCNSKCELCSSDSGLTVFQVPPKTDMTLENSIMLCENCRHQVEHPESTDVNHWYCLKEAIWSEIPAIQVMAWRLLNRFTNEGWAQDLLSQLYLEESVQKWAGATGFNDNKSKQSPATKDSNGNILANGDTVTLIKDLDVKGANFTAKRGTTVKNISLTENPEQIEGRVNGTQIVLLTRFLKKA
jgi:protein PhnA